MRLTLLRDGHVLARMYERRIRGYRTMGYVIDDPPH
jgi:hypothetical protein